MPFELVVNVLVCNVTIDLLAAVAASRTVRRAYRFGGRRSIREILAVIAHGIRTRSGGAVGSLGDGRTRRYKWGERGNSQFA